MPIDDDTFRVAVDAKLDALFAKDRAPEDISFTPPFTISVTPVAAFFAEPNNPEKNPSLGGAPGTGSSQNNPPPRKFLVLDIDLDLDLVLALALYVLFLVI